MTMLGPDGRPVTPIKLRKPGSSAQAGNQVAAQTPPAEPSERACRGADARGHAERARPGVNSGQVPEVPVVETPTRADGASA
jgi:hypothetical protein